MSEGIKPSREPRDQLWFARDSLRTSIYLDSPEVQAAMAAANANGANGGEEGPAWLQKLRSIPRQPFLFGPSPVQFLPRLTKELSPDEGVKIWAKRDDCNR